MAQWLKNTKTGVTFEATPTLLKFMRMPGSNLVLVPSAVVAEERGKSVEAEGPGEEVPETSETEETSEEEVRPKAKAKAKVKK